MKKEIEFPIPAQFSLNGILTNNFFEQSVDTRWVTGLDKNILYKDDDKLSSNLKSTFGQLT